MERLDKPKVTLVAYNIIRHLDGDVEHMVLVLKHIEVLVREYFSFIYNYKATIAEDWYIAKHGGVNLCNYYLLHDYHSPVYDCMLADQKEQSLKVCDRMESTISMECSQSSPRLCPIGSSFFFISVWVHVYIHFNMYDHVLSLPIPMDRGSYCVTRDDTLWKRYRLRLSQQAQTGQRSAWALPRRRKPVPVSGLNFPNRIFDVLTDILDGEIGYRRQNYQVPSESLIEAIKAEDFLMLELGYLLPDIHTVLYLPIKVWPNRWQMRTPKISFCSKILPAPTNTPEEVGSAWLPRVTYSSWGECGGCYYQWSVETMKERS